MKANPEPIRQLLENRQRYCVPIYQRHYVWTRDTQWEPFWNDVRTKAIERLNGRERRFSHFMGAVVLEPRLGASSRQVTSFQVVDGQQRLTTFQLFLAAARDYAQLVGFNDTVGLIEGYLFNDKQHLMADAEIEKFKVWPTQYDRELFQDIMTVGQKELRKKYADCFYKGQDRIYPYRRVPKLLGAYGYFYNEIKNAVNSDELEDEQIVGNGDSVVEEGKESCDAKETSRLNAIRRLDALWESLIEEFKVVEIRLEEGDDAQVIFETLNDRSEPLLAADLIRNNIFHRADARGEKAEKLFGTYWKFFEDPFWSRMEKQGRYKKERIEFFLANFVSGKLAGEVTLSKLFSEYKAFVKHQATQTADGYRSVEAELGDLVKYGEVYRRLLERNDNDALGRFARHLHPWEVTTVYPLVLRLWMEKELSEHEKEFCLSILLAFIVRRAICGLTTKNYNRYFLLVLRYLDLSGFSSVGLATFLTSQSAGSARFPNDQEFEQAWTSSPMYGERLTPLRVRTVLEAIERQKRKSYQETDQLKSDLTVEHILPRDWEEHWPLSDGGRPSQWEKMMAYGYIEEDDTIMGRIVRRRRLLHTFGNLTLLTKPLNSKVSNGPFHKKKEALNDQSLLVLNREVTKYTEWDEDAIEVRGRSLFEIAKALWPYPKTDASRSDMSAT